ncbi:MAG TPA: hypothetical protein VHU40_00210, partial [Polyangia bacterium]|nr:hypothetical protein [Polyangia bacterium]
MQPHPEVQKGQKAEGPTTRATRSVAGSLSSKTPSQAARKSSQPRSGAAAPNPWATGLGAFSVGLGLAEVVAPGPLARLIGIEDCATNRWCLRMAG